MCTYIKIYIHIKIYTHMYVSYKEIIVRTKSMLPETLHRRYSIPLLLTYKQKMDTHTLHKASLH